MTFHSFNDIRRFTLETTDGESGAVEDIYFDDDDHLAKYVLVDVGTWLSGHKALIDIRELAKIDAPGRRVRVAMTREEIEQAPPPDMHRPVSEQGADLPPQGVGGPLISVGAATHMLVPVGTPHREAVNPPKVEEEIAARREEYRDPHLRSMKHLLGYRIIADGERVGRVEDILFSPDDGRVRYFLADKGRILPGKSVVLSLDWMERIDHHEEEILLSVEPEKVGNAPGIEDLSELDRSQESRLYRHYNMPPYWV